MAMSILFSPSIGESLSIPVSQARAPNDTITLTFKARLGDEDFARVAKGHVRVQLWSNLPASSGDSHDHWKAFDFNVASDERLINTSDNDTAPPNGRSSSVSSTRFVDLATSNEGKRSVPSQELVLEIPIDLSAFGGERRYGFTYRILYGDGGLVWLGVHGRDGLVALTKTPVAGIDLGTGWKQAGEDIGGHGLILDVEDDTQGRAIAKVANLGDYQVWSFDKDMSLQTSSSGFVQDARSLVMLPRRLGVRQVNDPAYVLSASGGALLGVSPLTGSVTTTGGAGEVLLQTCYDANHLSGLVSGSLAYSGMADQVRVVKNEGWILLLSPREQSPARGLFIPTATAKNDVRIMLDFAVLAELLTSPLKELAPPEFCIFSPSTSAFEYVDTKKTVDTIFEGDSLVSFGVPSYGGQFTVSRVYNLIEEEEGANTKVSLLSQHQSVSIPQPPAIVKPIELPTPPPSPFLNRRDRNPKLSPKVSFSPEAVVIPRVDTIDIDDGQLLRRRSSALNKSEAKAEEANANARKPEEPTELAPKHKDREADVKPRQPEPRTSTAIKQRGLFRLFRGILSVVRVYTGTLFYLFYIMSLGPLWVRLRPTSRTSRSPSPSRGGVEEVDKTGAGPDVGAERGDEDTEGASTSASAGASFEVGKGDSEEESDESEETSSDVTVTGSDDQDVGTGGNGKAAEESSPPSEELNNDEENSTDGELLCAELYPTSGAGKAWVQLVLMTPGVPAHDGSANVTLAGLSKSVTVNGDVVDYATVRTLKAEGGKAGQDYWTYHLVEFPVPVSATTGKTVVKVLNHA